MNAKAFNTDVRETSIPVIVAPISVKAFFISYITLKMHFVLWDYEEPAIFYELDLLAIMILMIFK